MQQVGAAAKVHTYIWVVDVKNFESTLLMLNEGDEVCLALHALDKGAVPVLSPEKECRPDTPIVSTAGHITTISSGFCVSRKSQLQPSLEQSLRDFYDGSISCAGPNEILV